MTTQRRRRAFAVLSVLGLAVLASARADEQALDAARRDIDRYRAEIQRLEGTERGLLGELDRLRAELRLRESQVREVGLRAEQVEKQVAEAESKIAELTARRQARIEAITRRLRADYRHGRDAPLARLLGAARDEDGGRRFARYLDRRDAEDVHAFRRESDLLTEEREDLNDIRTQLATLQTELRTARGRLTRSADQRKRALAGIRDDQRRREKALGELRSAAGELERLAREEPETRATVKLDVEKFRGLLGWPASGEVLAGFGTRIHPRFQTKIPHPGLDIEGQLGDDIRTVFDGEVRYAAWMRGYGLTAIVDHGGELLSIYAHAAVLTVQPGEPVQRGQVIGKIGESGSLNGPMLYFELREGGKPVDPRRWLRRR